MGKFAARIEARIGSTLFEEAKHPRLHGKFASKGGIRVRGSKDAAKQIRYESSPSNTRGLAAVDNPQHRAAALAQYKHTEDSYHAARRQGAIATAEGNRRRRAAAKAAKLIRY